MMVDWDQRWKDEECYFGFDMDVERCCQGGVDMISVWNVGELHCCWGCDVSDLGLGLVDFPTQSLGGSSNLGCMSQSVGHMVVWMNCSHNWLAPSHLQILLHSLLVEEFGLE